MFGITFLAIDRTTLSRLERNVTFLPTVRAGSLKRLPRPTVKTAPFSVTHFTPSYPTVRHTQNKNPILHVSR